MRVGKKIQLIALQTSKLKCNEGRREGRKRGLILNVDIFLSANFKNDIDKIMKTAKVLFTFC